MQGFAPPTTATLVKAKADGSLSRYRSIRVWSTKEAHVDVSSSPTDNIDSIETEKKHDDAFILQDVESIMVEAPEQDTRRTIFGNHKPKNKLDISKDPLVNELRAMREMVNSCPEIWTYMNG